MWAPDGQRPHGRYARGRLVLTSGRRNGELRRAVTSSCGAGRPPHRHHGEIGRAGPLTLWDCINDNHD